MNTPTSSADAPKPKKTTWETIITLTPVLLTVMATLLAGLSSSEMTLSMYFRSVAAQNQSKVGDQWAFFQAKRIRGTTTEMQVGLLPVMARPGKLEPAMLEAASRRLTAKLRLIEKDADALLKAVNGDVTLSSAAEMFHKSASAKARQVENDSKALSNELQKAEVRDAFAYLGTNALPKIEEVKFEDETLTRALQEIEERKSEKQLAPVVLKVSESVWQQALNAALENASTFDKAGDTVASALRKTSSLISQHGMASAQVYQSQVLLEGAGADSGKFASGANHVEDMRRAADDLNDLYFAAWNDFTARRYRQEGRYNQRLAQLYEVQVNRNSALSDMHRGRSKHFFFGMLGAQAGVAIASFSLAARQRSILWSLAAVAGIGALIFSGYVYLYM